MNTVINELVQKHSLSELREMRQYQGGLRVAGGLLATDALVKSALLAKAIKIKKDQAQGKIIHAAAYQCEPMLSRLMRKVNITDLFCLKMAA